MTNNQDILVGADAIYPSSAELEAQLNSGKKLHVYFGIDPTNPVLHLGHTVPLRLLKRFQDNGQRVTLLIGDFTATVGDPSGRDAQRQVLTKEVVTENVLAIKEQVFKVLDPAKTELRYNSEWYDDPNRMGSLRKIMELGHSFTAAQLWERDMFQTRQAKGTPVSITEFLYPVLQAYDSVELDVDVEVGGNDQMFNMLAGRTLLRQKKNKEKFVITMPLILGTDGRKMSKSYGNSIGVNDAPNDMFGKLMSIDDSLIESYFLHVTDRFITDEAELKSLIAQNPRDAKAMLAREVVSLYHGTAAAEAAESTFNATFRDHSAPEEMEERALSNQPRDIAELVLTVGAATSRSEAQRLIEQGAVTFDEAKLTDPFTTVELRLDAAHILKVGKRRFYKVTLTA